MIQIIIEFCRFPFAQYFLFLEVLSHFVELPGHENLDRLAVILANLQVSLAMIMISRDHAQPCQGWHGS